MSDTPEYTPPNVWTWNKPSGGRFENINRPIAGATHEKELPVGRHPLQLYSQGTPNGVISKLNAAVVDALADLAVQSRLADISYQIFPREQQTPEALAALQKSEIEKWWPIIKAAGIKAE